MHISDGAKIILNALEDAGFSSYVVGGCVRDYFLGNINSDTDIATCAMPYEVENILSKKILRWLKRD